MNVAVIGVGNIGQHHARIYKELSPEVQLAAVCDKNKKQGKAIAKRFGCLFYEDYNDMVSKHDIDAVSIAVPTIFHYQVAKDFLAKGIHVLVEKPITPDVPSAKKMIVFAKKKNCVLHVGHIERFNPAVKKVKELITSGKLGTITAIVSRRVGGSPFHVQDTDVAVDLAIHDIDIINYLMEALPNKIVGNKQQHIAKAKEDSVEMFLTYGKASAYIQANWITPIKVRKLNITGTDGYIEMDYINQKVDHYKSDYNKFKEAATTFSDYILTFSEQEFHSVPVEKKEPLKEELTYFIEAIKTNKREDASYAVDALKIAKSL